MTWRAWFWLLVPFTLVNLAASAALAIPYGVHAWRLRAGAVEIVAKRRDGRTRIWGRPGAQSLGCNFIYYASTHLWDRAGLRVHERCHSVQGLLLGLLGHLVFVPLAIVLGWPWWLGVAAGQLTFGAAYGAHFLVEWALIKFGPWHAAYMRIWAERQAYRIQDEFEAGQRPGAWGS